MVHDRSGFSKKFARGWLDRRQVIKGLGITATAAFAAAVAPKATAGLAGQMATASGFTGFKAVAYNHINYQVTDYAKVRDFYVDLFSMKPVYDDGKQCSVEFGDPPNAIYIRPLTQPLNRPTGEGRGANWAAQMGNGNVDHFAISIEDFNLDAVKAELTRRGLNPQPDGPYAWTITDPNGYRIQICAKTGVFPGQGSPTAKESDGQKNLANVPKSDGTGFKAYAMSHVVLDVADVDKNRDFYMDLFGMRLIYYKPGDVFGVDSKQGPICFLRFGQNSLYFRKSERPDHKPYVAHFTPMIENYDQMAVKAELERRGFKPLPDTKYGWQIQDPAGMRIEVAGPGVPEHIGGDCNGGNGGCPGGPDK
jgi:catechol 2,3-dioxygenase-like lactoylglutathione lyase family enzyme